METIKRQTGTVWLQAIDRECGLGLWPSLCAGSVALQKWRIYNCYAVAFCL